MNIIKQDIITRKDLQILIEDWKRELPQFVSYDTETDGLNIKYNKPFLITFGFVTNDLKTIYTYALDYELRDNQLIIDTIYVLKQMFKLAQKIIGHHIIFDIHMQANINLPFNNWDKFTDTQFYIRLAHDAKPQKHGGPPLGLKEYTARYINPNAKFFEKKLKNEITKKKREATIALKLALKKQPLPKNYYGNAKSWTMKVVETFIKDQLNEIKELPNETAYIIKHWLENTPDPNNYRLLNRTNVTEYAHYDIVFTLQIFLSLKDKIVERGQQKTLRREEEALYGLYTLERNGIPFDYEKAIYAKEKTRNYILNLRKELIKLAGENIKVGQSKTLLTVFLKKYDIKLPNTDKSTLEKVLEHKEANPQAKRLVKIIGELRSLEKWYATYLMKWINEAKQYGNIVYPTYHQVGTITGRVSSEFQQFPKAGKYTIDGEYLFHPRELFKPPPNHRLVFFDYSAMEMRILAIYTILIKQPDLNLIRAFQPYKCYSYSIVNDMYMFTNKDPNWEQYDWYKEEDNTLWKPTDIHALTACKAFNVTPEDPKFKSFYRPHGKATNFSIVYGATPKTIMAKQKVTMLQAQKLYNAYFETYPGVKSYNEYVRQHIEVYGYAQNLFGRRYYGSDAHKSKNYLIQGTGADYTKSLLPKIMKIIKGTGIKLQGYLHDEFSFAIPLDMDDTYLIQIREIMESLNTPIKLKVDVEVAYTNWKEKKDYDLKHS